jgi:hypothetical protein
MTFPFCPTAGTIMCSSMAVSFVTSFSVSLTSEGREVTRWRVPLILSVSKSGGVSASRAARRRSSTSSTRFVFWPPRHINTAAKIPQRKLAGIRVPVVQAGRVNLFPDDEYNTPRGEKCKPTCQDPTCSHTT